MSAQDHLSRKQFDWLPTTDRFGGRTEVANTEHGGYSVDGNGAGRNKWTVEYPDGDYGMTQTKREARAWAATDHADRTQHPLRKEVEKATGTYFDRGWDPEVERMKRAMGITD